MVYPELDFAEVLSEVEGEFGVSFPVQTMRPEDCTFGAVVMRVAGMLALSTPPGGRLPSP